MDVTSLTEQEIEEIEEKRKESLGSMFAERQDPNPIYRELRYLHGYLHLGPYLIHHQTGDKFELLIREDEKKIYLNFICVTDQQQGRGTQMMNLLVSLADRYDYKIILQVAPKFGVGKRILVRFYKRFGFLPRNKSNVVYERTPLKNATKEAK